MNFKHKSVLLDETIEALNISRTEYTWTARWEAEAIHMRSAHICRRTEG